MFGLKEQTNYGNVFGNILFKHKFTISHDSQIRSSIIKRESEVDFKLNTSRREGTIGKRTKFRNNISNI